MEAFTVHRGRTACIWREDIDTDQIIPSRFCKRITRTGFEDALFEAWRRDPGFVLNDPLRAGASVLIAGRNFGTGSSREHAVWALRDFGFKAVIAVAFGEIFHNNALKNGLLPITLDEPVVTVLAQLAQARADLEVTVDLQRCEIRVDGDRWPFEISERSRQMILNGQDEIDLTLGLDDRVRRYEAGRPAYLPTMSPR